MVILDMKICSMKGNVICYNFLHTAAVALGKERLLLQMELAKWQQKTPLMKKPVFGKHVT